MKNFVAEKKPIITKRVHHGQRRVQLTGHLRRTRHARAEQGGQEGGGRLSDLRGVS